MQMNTSVRPCNFGVRAALAPSLLAAAFVLGSATDANADVQVQISDTGTGVKFAWTGSIDTSSLTSIGLFNNTGGIRTDTDLVFSSTTAADGEWFENVVSGPSIGTSPYTTYPNVLTGDFFAMHMSFDSFIMPTGYVSGSNIIGNVEFTGPSIASLGIIPGPHVFTINNSPSTITLQSVVPEPTSLCLLSAGAMLTLRRKR